MRRASLRTPSRSTTPPEVRRWRATRSWLLGALSAALLVACGERSEDAVRGLPTPAAPGDASEPAVAARAIAEAAGVPGSFRAIDLLVDPLGASLGAWHVEVRLRAEQGAVEILGVEGGDHPSFAEAPAYDPAALVEGPRATEARIVLASFDLSASGPRDETRVARLHVFVEPREGSRPAGAIEVGTRAIAAADAEGQRITVRVRSQVSARARDGDEAGRPAKETRE